MEEADWNGKREWYTKRERVHIIEGVSCPNRSAWWADRAGNFPTDGWLDVYILMGSIDRGGGEAGICKIYTYPDCVNTSSIFSFLGWGGEMPWEENSSCSSVLTDSSWSQLFIHHYTPRLILTFLTLAPSFNIAEDNVYFLIAIWLTTSNSYTLLLPSFCFSSILNTMQVSYRTVTQINCFQTISKWKWIQPPPLCTN